MSEDESQYGFQGVWIPATLWGNSELSWMEKCLVAEIDWLSTANNPCFASSERLAKHMKTTPGAMREMLSQLMKKGAIWQLGSDGRRTWRCVNPLYSADQGKYRAWMQDVRYQPQLTSRISPSLHPVSAPADTEVPVEIPVKKDTNPKGIEAVTKKEEKHIGQRPLPGLNHYEDPLPSKEHPRGMPSLDQIKSEISRLGLPASDAENTYDKWVGNGFKSGGQPIKSWTATLRYWHRNGFFQSQKTIKPKPGELMTNEILDALAQNPAYKKIDVQAEAWKFKEWCERTGNRPLVTSFIKSLNTKL